MPWRFIQPLRRPNVRQRVKQLIPKEWWTGAGGDLGVYRGGCLVARLVLMAVAAVSVHQRGVRSLRPAAA
jgi:hypothetical protein